MLETDSEKTHFWACPAGIGYWSDLIKQMTFDLRVRAIAPHGMYESSPSFFFSASLTNASHIINKVYTLLVYSIGCTNLTALLFISHEFAKHENTIYFDAGSKTAITRTILNGLAWYFLWINANVLLRCLQHQNVPIIWF